MHTSAPFQNHGAAELTSFLGGLDVIPPGVAEIQRWLSDVSGTPAERSAYMLCGVGVKG
jgi:hypothetical protein